MKHHVFFIAIIAIMLFPAFPAKATSISDWDEFVSRATTVTEVNGGGESKIPYEAVVGLEMKLDALEKKISDLESENLSLKNQISEIEPVTQTTVVKEIQTIGGSSDSCEELEKRLTIVEKVISMMEVNIGSLYARMDQLLAPINKILGL